ncbi:MAG: DUF1572 family protein [Phycisphaeraceae bacterium]|nr:DUF1572 family protein [Phycisphaeraceae bacterium]
MSRVVLSAIEAEFRRYRMLSERAAEQLPWDQLRIALDKETNSIAVIMKHVGGNLRSRWTDALTTDGEKPWRNRDTEFVDDFADREALMSIWSAGWSALETQLAALTDADLAKTITIRGEPHTVMLALMRSVTHIAYHAGQIMQVARVLASRSGIEWKTLTVARGGSAEFNKRFGFDQGTLAR